MMIAPSRPSSATSASVPAKRIVRCPRAQAARDRHPVGPLEDRPADAPQRHARACTVRPARTRAREPDRAQERALLPALEVHPDRDLADPRRRALVVVDRRQRLEDVRRRAGRDRVGGADEVLVGGEGGHVAVAEAGGAGEPADRDLHADVGGQPAGRAAQQRAGGLGDRERGDEGQRRGALREPDPALVGGPDAGHRAAVGVEVVGEDADRHGRRQRAGPAGDGVALVVGDRAERVAQRRVLVGRRRARDRDRVVDHAVDVGVLEQQAPLAGVLERVAERPHAVLVGVGDRPDRADLDVAHRVGDADRGPRAHRLRGERAERAGGRRDHLAAGLAPGALERAAERGAHARDRERGGERLRAGHQRAVAARGPCRCGASTGVPRIASIGVASTTSPPYSPSDSEIAPALRSVPCSSRQ